MCAFHNPYNFIRTPDRTEAVLSNNFLGDYDPSNPDRQENHSRYWSERYTGEIPIKLTTITPLFITDPNSKQKIAGTDDKPHDRYDTLDYIPATALKGMLSSAYEAITNSRFRVFSEKQHSKRLGMRISLDRNADLVPGRIEKDATTGEFSVRLYRGTITGARQINSPQYAAWVPCSYNLQGNTFTDSGSFKSFANKYVTNVTLQLCRYHRHLQGGRSIEFSFWYIKQLVDGSNTITCSSPLPVSATQIHGKLVSGLEGYIVSTGKTIKRKHNERFFFNPDKTKLGIDKKLKAAYENLIYDYQLTHVNNTNPPIRDRSGNIESILGQHITDRNRQELKEGDFVYVHMSGTVIQALYPVQIPRKLYPATPWEFLHQSLRPAINMSELSPADRLFGWVDQSKDKQNSSVRAWKGKLRFSDATFAPATEAKTVADSFYPPRTLKILGGPKPAQARFYLGDKDGKPQAHGLTKEKAGYNYNENGEIEKRLRGRKVYLHHQNFDETKLFTNDQTGQNRSISSWIPIGRQFNFTLRYENLCKEELGALLWLLTLTPDKDDKDFYFRLGYGKPLGLGSVKLEINGKATYHDMAKRYNDLSGNSITAIDETKLKELKDYFLKTVEKSYQAPPNKPEYYADCLVSGLKKALKGVSGIIAYAESTDNNAELKIYEWFAANEKDQNSQSLPEIGKTLPSYQTSGQKPQSNHRPNNQQQGQRQNQRYTPQPRYNQVDDDSDCKSSLGDMLAEKNKTKK